VETGVENSENPRLIGLITILTGGATFQ
jgi:hypothetical protein